MKLTPKQIQDNWSIFLNNIEVHIISDRKETMLSFYKSIFILLGIMGGFWV